ncbi:MAG: tetratricopeptide repeat protein [Magnetospirillum sp.]|nr:tetratricopeptide repeat protein [Magnetospirillum sp.]
MCADCHSTGLRKGYDLAADSYHTTASDLDVACEACHGPGAAHVAWAKAGAKPGGNGLTVALHARPDRWGETDSRGIRRHLGAVDETEQQVCAPCHARRRTLSDGADAGSPLLDTHMPSLLDETLYHADGQIQDEVFEVGSFLQSRMQRAGVTCSDCHEPHGLALRAEGNALCAQCHLPERFDAPAHHRHAEGTEAAQCVTCHMPTRTYMGVHVRRDHGFRLPAPRQAAAVGAPDPCTRCHADKGAEWAGKAVAAWTGGKRKPQPPGFAAALAAGRRGSPQAAQALAAAAGDGVNPAIARATALSLLARTPDPKTLTALQAGLDDPDPLVRLGALRGLEPYPPGERRRALGLLRDPVKAVRIEAARLLAATIHPGTEGLKPALDEWVAAERANAERPESHLNLGTLWAELGRLPEAEDAFRTALRLDPRFAPAMLNLADLYRVQHRDGEAHSLLRQAVATAPDDADAHFALGLCLVRLGQRAEAVPPWPGRWPCAPATPASPAPTNWSCRRLERGEQAVKLSPGVILTTSDEG